MKNILFLPVLLLFVTTMSFGQCDKNVTLSASKTEYLDEIGAVQRSVDESSSIEISKTEVTIVPGNPDQKMHGIIQSYVSCDWTSPYKTGKTVIKAHFDGPEKEPRHVTLTIEGKEGKITLLMEIEEMPNRKILASVDKFDEKKPQ